MRLNEVGWEWGMEEGGKGTKSNSRKPTQSTHTHKPNTVRQAHRHARTQPRDRKQRQRAQQCARARARRKGRESTERGRRTAQRSTVPNGLQLAGEAAADPSQIKSRVMKSSQSQSQKVMVRLRQGKVSPSQSRAEWPGEESPSRGRGGDAAVTARGKGWGGGMVGPEQGLVPTATGSHCRARCAPPRTPTPRSQTCNPRAFHHSLLYVPPSPLHSPHLRIVH